MVVTIVSGNRRKADFLSGCLGGAGIGAARLIKPLNELQADSIEAVARDKAAQARSCAALPVLVEDAGLVIDSLRGFPGPVTRYVLQTLGASGLVNMAAAAACVMESVTVLIDVRDREHLFVDRVKGTLAAPTDPHDLLDIFVPEGEQRPFADITPDRRAWYLGQRHDRLVAWLKTLAPAFAGG